MGIFTQVGLLLWKNAKLKIRSPLLTVTTLLWPIIIFVIIAIIRTRLPPVQQRECHFKPQALPSVGTVDFMQSMMCDLKTECLSVDQVPKSNEPPTYGASIGLLLDDLEPLFSNESSIINDLESLPDTLGPLINLTKTLEDTFNMINEQNIYLGDFFTNRTKMQEILLNEFHGAEGDLIEAILAARINVLELLDVIGYSDSESLVCNATSLQTYVIFPPNTDVENITSALCKLKREDIENIINIILEELDVDYIANEVTTFLRALDRYGLDNFTRDVLEIREQLENITALDDFVDVLPQLIQLTRLVPDIQRFLEAIQGSNAHQTLYVLRRIIAAIDWEGSPPWWSDVQELLFRITDIMSAVFDMILDVRYGDVTFKDIFGNGKVLQDVLRRFSVSSDSLVGLLNSTIQADGISDFIFFLSNPDATVEAYCRGEINLDDFLTSEVAVNESMLRNALCKLENGTSFLEALLNEYSVGRSITEIIQSLNGLFKPIGPGLDLGPLINETREIFQDIDLLPDFIKELPSILGVLDSPQFAPLLTLATLNQSSLQEFLITMLVEGTTVVEGMFTQRAFWPIIQGQLAYQLVILDAQIAVINRVMGGALIDAFKDDPFTQVGELFLEFGPNITEAILSTFLDPSKIEELVSMSQEDQQLVLCSDFIEYPLGLDVTYAKQELCKLNPAELYPSHVEVWASYFPEVVHAIEFSQLVFFGNVSLIPSDILGNATFKNVIKKHLEFPELLTTAFHTKIDLEDFFAGLTENVSVTGSPDEWNAMLNRLTAKSLPALQESVLVGEWESVLDYIGDIPEVHSFIAGEAMEDIIIQDLNIVLSIFNSLSRGEVPGYGGETEKLLRGIVFLTQQGNAIQAAILEAYQDPVKALVLGSATDITLVLCNATLRNSLLDLPSVDIDVLDSSLCNLNFGLLINETVQLMQFEKLSDLFYYIKNGLNDPIDLNLTAVAVHTDELVKTIEELDESWQNWVELVVNGSNWLALAPQFTPQAWMDTWNTMLYMASFENLTAVFQEIDPRNLTILIEDLVMMTLPDGEVFLHKAAAMEYAVIKTMQGANNASRLLQGMSEGIIIPEFQGTETAKVIETLLEVDLVQLMNAISDPEVIGVLSQVGYPQFFCNATIRDVLLDLPRRGIDTSLFERTVCSVDLERAAEELYMFVNGPQVEQWVIEFRKISAPDQYLKPSDIDWDIQAVILELFFKNMANISWITVGLAERLDIPGILAYYEKQWISDMIGVDPTNHTDWLNVLTQQLNMVWEQLDDSVADIPGWDQYRTNVYIILSAIEQITSMNTTAGIKPFTLASIVPNVTEFIIILREIPNLSDEIIYQLLYTPIDPVMLIELASYNSWNETLCNAELLSGVFVQPADLNLTQLQGALCSIDFEAVIGQLSQGAGIEHLVSMIIDQITSFSDGDDFGIGDYDPTKWASRIEQLINSFDVQNIQGVIQSLASELLMIYEDIDTQLENVTGWIEFKADLNILLTILQYTTPVLGNGTNGDEPISLSMLVPNATELELILAQNTPFSSEVIQTIIYTPINPTRLLELVMSSNWNATLCTEEGLRMLFALPDGLNLTELQGVLCSVNFQYTFMELMQNGAIENIVSVVIDQLYLSIIPEFTLPGLDFSDLTDLISQIFSMIQAGNMQNIAQYFESLNSLNPIFVNETWYQDTIKQLQFMDFITKTFTDKIIMLEGRTITLPNLGNLLANSSEFQRILLDDYQLGLGLVEALMTLGLQPDKLISFFNMSNPLVTLCVTGQFSSFFYSPLNPDLDITSLEEAVCEIDFEQLVMELKDMVSFDEILEQIQLLAFTDQTGPYNWTAGYLTDERLSQAISYLVINPPMLSFDEIWVNKTLETLIGLADRWNKAQERLVGGAPSDIASSFDSLAEILQQGVMANQSWAIEMASALRTTNAVLDYTNNKLWALPGRNITLQDLLPPDIASYIEANSDLTPDLIALLLQAAVNTEALLAANGTWLEFVCSNAQNLPMMFQVPPDIDLDAAYQSLCSLDFDQWTVAYMQEIQNILTEVENGKEVNFTSITENFQKLALGIEALIENPPTLVKYNEEWFQSIIQRTGAILEATYNESQFLTPHHIPMLLNDMWNQIAASNPSLLMQARINDYIIQVLIDMLNILPGQTYTLPRLDELFGDTTYVRELLSHSDIAPEIIDTFMILAVDQEKITYLINTPDVFVELCQSGHFSTFFQLPPDSPTNITLVEEAVCTTNLTLVLAELDQKFKFTEIATQIERIVTNDPTLPPFNQTAASLRMMEFSNLIVTLSETPPKINVDLVWWENVYNRSEVIVLQWLQRLTDQALNGSSVPGLDMVLAQLKTLDIPGFDADQFEMWIRQSQRIQALIAQAIEGPTANGTTGYIVPVLLELFPEPDLIRELLNSSGLPEDVTEIFLQMIPQITKWLPMLSGPDPLRAVCEGGLFQDIFLLTNASIDIQSIEDQICSLNLTDIDGLISQIFMSDFDALILELLQTFVQVPGLDPQTALNVSQEISAIISSLISDPANFQLDPQSIIWLLQSLQVPGLNQSWVQDWTKQVQLVQYINNVFSDWLTMNNGTELVIPAFSDLFPDPSVIVQLFTDLGVPTDITQAFLYSAIQADQWLPILSGPEPLRAVCEGGLFQDIFLLTNTSIDIQSIEDQICSLNLTDIDGLISHIFMSDFDALILELLQAFAEVPGLDTQTALNVSREISAIISSLISDPANFQLDPQSIIKLLESLQVPGLNQSWVQDWIKQIQLMQDINNIISNWLTINNGTELVIPAFSDLFPDPSVIVQLFTDLGVPTDITQAFLYSAIQADQWLPMLSGPEPLGAVCEGGLFQDIFLLTNTSIDIQSIEDQICSLNLTDIDGLISQIFMSDFDALILELLQAFAEVPGLDTQTALNVSREISAIISSLISDPANFQLDPQSIIKLLKSLQVPGLNQSWVQDWIKQVQLMQYINNVISDWLTMNYGTELAIPTFNDLFPDPNILVQLFTDLGVPTDITQAVLYSAIQADQWTQVWVNPDPLQAICNSSLFQDIFTQTLNTSIDIRTIQDTLCSINLSTVDTILNDIFKTNRMIIQISLLLFNDPTMDWQTAWNTSLHFSQMFDELFQNPPVTDQDIKQVTLSVFKELESMLRIYGVWDDTEHFLKYIEFSLQVIGHHLSNSNNFLKDLIDPAVSLDNLVSYVGMSPEEIKAALLGDITNIFLLADLYYTEGDWNNLFHCNNKEQFESDFNSTNDGFLNLFAVREVFCSLNISEFFETAKNLYGFDFLRLTELGYIRSRNNSSPDLDINSVIDLGTDIAQMISDLVNLPKMLTQDLDLDFFVMRLTNLSNAITAQDYEQLVVLLDELAPLLQSPEVVYQIKASLMSGSDIMSWLESIDFDDPVVWLERIEGALNETLLWYTILPAINFVDLLIETDLDSLNPFGYRYYDLITNETIIQQYLTEILGLAPEYAEAIALSGIKDVFVLADHHLSDTWESTYCITVDPANSTDFNLTAVYSLLCNLDREQFFDSLNTVMGIDVLRLTQWIDDIKYPERRVVEQFDWQTLVDNIQTNIDMIKHLASMGQIRGVNLTQVISLMHKLQEGMEQFDYEVLIEQMEILNQILYLNGTWDNIKGYMNTVTNIVQWLNLQLESAHANNVTLLELITHHATALQNLYYILGYDVFSQLITSLVDPQQAMTLQSHNDIETVICDADSFSELLKPTMHRNTTSLQGMLCSHLMSGHPTIANDLMTHFNIAPLEHEITVLATNNQGKGFQDQDIDMRNMINEFEKLSNVLLVVTDMMTNVGFNTTLLPNLDNIYGLITMISEALISTLPTKYVALWNEIIYPIVGRLDLAMIMVNDLFFTLPDREAEIAAVLNNDTIVNAAIPVILIELPNVIKAWNEVIEQPPQVPVLSKLILELLKGSLEGISEDPSLWNELLTNSTMESTEALVDLFVSLDRMFLTDFGQQLIDVFRIRQNAERLDIITDPDSKNFLPFNAAFVVRTKEFVEKAVACSEHPDDCIIDLEVPATFKLLVMLAEVASQLPAGSLESLEDMFTEFAPILEEFLQQTVNGSSELEQSLNMAFSFLRTVFDSNKVGLNDVLSIFEFESALLNNASVYQFLRENTDLTEIDLMMLRNGSINTTVLFEVFNLGVNDSINLLCHEALIDDLLVNVNSDLKEEIIQGVCSNGTLIAVDFLRSNLNLKTVIELVTNTTGHTFPEFLLETLDAVGNLPGVDYEVLGEFVAIVIPPVFENGFPSISDLGPLAENINITRRALRSVDALMTITEDLFVEVFPNYREVQRLVRTLLDNLSILELLTEIPDLTVSNVLKNEEVLEDYLFKNTQLERDEARDIIYSTFNLEELFLTEVTVNLEMLCDPDYLSTILILPNQTNAIILADTMCGLSGDDIATLIATVLPFVDVSAIVNVSYMADSFGGAFSISNTTIMQVMQSIASLETVTMALPALQEALSNFDNDPAVEKLREIAELGFFTGEEISAVTQEIVCGSTSSRKRRDVDDKIRRFKRAVTSENSDDFCQDIFSSIVDGVDGQLVWAYLKPIVVGRILYSPDIPPIRRIIEKANRTFENIALTQRFADAWLTSGGDLGTMLDPDTLEATKTLLENSYVQGLLEDQYGISSDQFTDILNGNLTSMPPGQVQTLNLLAELVSNLTRCFTLNRFVGYANEDSMVQAARSLDEDNTMLAALAFDIPEDATELPAHIKYKIRMDTDNTPPTDRLRNRFFTRSAASDFVFDFRYLRGYIMLQDMVEGSIVSLQASPDLQPPGVYLQLTPYPCFLSDQFTSIFTLILPLVMTIGFVVLIGVMTHQLVYEKERGIEELMKVMGLPGGANWWAWFISNSLILILLSCVVVIILKFGNILPLTDWSLLLVFILDYFFSIIMFCYLASAVFQRASIASLASVLVYLLFYLPYLAVFASESLLDTLWKPILTSLFCPSTFSFGCVLVSQFETLGTGAQWDLVWQNPLEEDVTNIAFVLIALAVDGAIYLIVGWYIRTLFPGKYGVPRSWYFPLQPSFWFHCSISRKQDMTQYINSAYDAEAGVTLTNQGSVVEEEPSSHHIGIAILNLTKVYRSCFKEEKVAIDNLTLNFFEGQVTAVLGHNGAGKTTTINIITGLFPATSGKVFLQGVSVAKKVSAARENLGVCVQHNALYDNLTVREHMAMTGRVKGLKGKELDDDIYTLLEDVGLLKKSEEKVKNLSGGMKRKLSVAMAFVGHSRIVVLDEPTSGVDPHARRAIWNLILKHKTGRTIMLCTHFMDEADILGDRIAILDRGNLRCCGSPAFLKSRFSSGYHLSLSKEPTSGAGTPTDQAEKDYKTKAEPNIYDTMKSASSDIPSTSSGIATDPGSFCDSSQVTDFIQGHIPSAMLQDDIGSELVYVLPVENGEREKFQELFQDLDNSLGDLRIKSYGISDTTLKEVFLKVSTSRSIDGDAAVLRNNNWSLRKPSETFTIASGISRGNIYQPNGQFDIAVLLSAWGILIKRLHFMRRDWQGLIWTVLMPVVLVALAIGFSQLNQINREYQQQLTPAMFNPNSYVFFSDESESDMGQRLTDALINPPGLGTTCMADADQMDLYPCVESNSHTIDQLANFDLTSLSEVPEGQCTCTDTGFGQECLPGAGGVSPPTWVTDTLVHLQNISMKEDKDRYLLDTQMKFRNSRFGGVSWFDVMESNETQAKAWFNNRGYHAMPTFLNVMNNIILRATVNNNSHEYGITAYNHPLELSKQDLGVDIWLETAKTFGIVIVIVTALVLIPSGFSMFLVTENINGSKRLHHISGVGTLTYWLTNLIWDMLSFCIPIGLMLVVLYIFNYRGLILASNIGAFVALVFLYGFAIMSQIYIFIPFFKESGSAFIFIFCLLLLEAIISNLPNWLIAVDAVSENETRVFEILNYFLLLFSPYCFSSGVLSLIQNQAMADIYRAFGVDEGIYEQPFHILKWHLVALAVEGVVAFMILLIVDAMRNSSCSSCLDPNANDPPSYNDNEDVMEEKELVLGGGGGSNKNALVLKELRKVYRGPGHQKLVAVNDLCLGVSRGECFGLLGVNGAGKTSTFRMIVGDLSPTEGTIKTRAESIGYCPQENAMYPQLTGEELLYCYARMKGINSSRMSKAVAEICEELGMERYVRKRISTYSGGMKRSLAVAVALLGKPELILMDEPTTGMDPITKQRVLTSIVNVIRDNRSVILTSHSMEECEAVCTRLAIMVNGQFCCLGSPQHVKNRHGHGYSLVVRGQKTAKTDMTLITGFVHRSFPGAELKEHHHNVLRFQLPPHNITVATIFGIMEREKTSLNLEDYSVSQTTLDEVFVNFAKKQTDGLQDETSSTASAQEVSIINRAFEPDDDADVDVFPRNTRSAATQL